MRGSRAIMDPFSGFRPVLHTCDEERSMPSRESLTPGTPWVELRTTAADWDAADPGLLLGMLGQGLWIRAFEEYVLELAAQGLVHGPAHSSIGQEGGAV